MKIRMKDEASRDIAPRAIGDAYISAMGGARLSRLANFNGGFLRLANGTSRVFRSRSEISMILLKDVHAHTHDTCVI